MSAKKVVRKQPRSDWFVGTPPSNEPVGYSFSPNDQRSNNWLLFVEDDDALRPKTRYRKLICGDCYQYDREQIFAAGFDPKTEIHARGDIFHSAEGIYSISERLRDIIKQHRIGGIRLKKIGTSGWYAALVTLRVEADARVYKETEFDGRKKCTRCKRAVSVYGVYEFARQIDVPKLGPTFFTTKVPREGLHSSPDIFVSADVIPLLKQAGIKGGMFSKLLNANEEKQLKASIKAERERWLPKTKIFL